MMQYSREPVAQRSGAGLRAEDRVEEAHALAEQPRVGERPRDLEVASSLGFTLGAGTFTGQRK